MAEEELTDEERAVIVRRMSALALTIEKAARELHDLSDALRTKAAPKKKELDEFGDPTYRFARPCVIPENLKMTRKMRDYALSKGFNASTLSPVWEDFVNYYRRTGKKWADWTAVWQKWVRTELERRAKGSGSTRDTQEL